MGGKMELCLALELLPFGIDEFKFHKEKLPYLKGKVNSFHTGGCPGTPPKPVENSQHPFSLSLFP
jgi:hypothetical protein